ncbi:hypothetical protein FKP32DRAFT_1678642 [Trametes sanguinea]|nr:hypothetical protein FKP32DRAFT_1678642 [Trametes sanguinea]
MGAAHVELANELIDAATAGDLENLRRVLLRIQHEISWTREIVESEHGQALKNVIHRGLNAPQYADNQELRGIRNEILAARAVQLKDEDIRQTEALWWHVEPPPQGVEPIPLIFRDVTAEYKKWHVDVWPPETVGAAPSEVFRCVAQRFRVQANRKHRHPFWPSLHFDAVLTSGRVSFDALGLREVAEVLRELAEACVVSYVRNDEDNLSEITRSPARYFNLWDRTLPGWCVTPDHWLEPIPPPGYAVQDSLPGPLPQLYKKVPTLHLPGSGRHIIPSAKVPQLIPRSLYIPVRNRANTAFPFAALEQEADLVPRGAHLIPGHISLDDARALLGRVVQSSMEPLPDPDIPRAQRPKINKFAAQRLGFAWGLETAEDGSPSWLHCVQYNSDGWGEYVLDLTGQKREYQEYSPISVKTIRCAWVGAVLLAVDHKAIKMARASDEAGAASAERALAREDEVANEALVFDEWYEHTRKCIKALNRKKTAPVVEVGPDGAFVGGDLETAKGEADEFDVHIVGAKPGVWLVSINTARIPHDDDHDGHVCDNEERQIIRFVWARDGTVNYASLPRRSAIRPPAPDPDTEWEVLEKFSVDSGCICIFSKHALDALLSTGPEASKQAMLEALIDDDGETKGFVPGGVIVSGDDGVFEVEGRRDASGRIVELRVML